MRTESSPIGRLIEQFLAAAFTRPPLRAARSSAGRPTSTPSRRRTRPRSTRSYYVPSNMTIAIVGDVKADARSCRSSRRTSGGSRRRRSPSRCAPSSRAQTAERQVVISDPAQPFYLEGYHRPAVRPPGRRRLRRDAGPAVERPHLAPLPLPRARQEDRGRRVGLQRLPGRRSTRACSPFFGVPTPGHTPEEVQAAIRDEIERLKKEDVTDDELEMVKTRAKANLIRGLDSNQGLAGPARHSRRRATATGASCSTRWTASRR